MTNYDEFKAIADDIAEMYANGYADYAEYFSETFSGIGEISAVTRLSDRVYALRGVDTTSVEFTKGMKEIAIDAILAIGEINITPVNNKTVASVAQLLSIGERLYCCKEWNSHGLELIRGESYEVSDITSTHYHLNRLRAGDTVEVPICFPIDEHFQKIIEKRW